MENYALYGDLLHAYQKSSSLATSRYIETTEGAWRNDPDMHAIRTLMCDWIRHLDGHFASDPTSVFYGFKEIRFEDVDHLIQVFPDAFYIINYRESDFVFPWWFVFAEQNATARKIALMSKIARAKNVKSVPLESFSVQTFNNILEWLNISNCTFTDVVHFNDDVFSADRRPVLKGQCVAPSKESRLDYRSPHPQLVTRLSLVTGADLLFILWLPSCVAFRWYAVSVAYAQLRAVRTLLL